jgi:hypothetical protein
MNRYCEKCKKETEHTRPVIISGKSANTINVNNSNKDVRPRCDVCKTPNGM